MQPTEVDEAMVEWLSRAGHLMPPHAPPTAPAEEATGGGGGDGGGALSPMLSTPGGGRRVCGPALISLHQAWYNLSYATAKRYAYAGLFTPPSAVLTNRVFARSPTECVDLDGAAVSNEPPAPGACPSCEWRFPLQSHDWRGCG